jgi:hypothetical protein
MKNVSIRLHAPLRASLPKSLSISSYMFPSTHLLFAFNLTCPGLLLTYPGNQFPSCRPHRGPWPETLCALQNPISLRLALRENSCDASHETFKCPKITPNSLMKIGDDWNLKTIAGCLLTRSVTLDGRMQNFLWHTPHTNTTSHALHRPCHLFAEMHSQPFRTCLASLRGRLSSQTSPLSGVVELADQRKTRF